MALLIAVFAVCLVAPIGIGVAAHLRGWSLWGGPVSWGRTAAARFGRVRAAVLITVAGWACTAVVCLGLGFAAKAMQGAVDEPAFRWIHARVHGGSFTRLNEKLTYMGNNPIIQLVALIAVILLGCAYRRRGWWLPLLSIGVAYLGEKYLQRVLGHVVDRGHPPTTLGTFPSGGVGRILAVYAVIVLLAVALLPELSDAWRAGLWTGLATAAVVEAFTRIYLSKHWLTDAVFGLPFGTLLTLTGVAALAALLTGSGDRAETQARPAAEAALR